MRHALFSADEICSLCRDLRILVINDQIPAHAGRQVDQYISAAVPDKFHSLFEKIDIPTAFAGVGITNVQMDNRRTGVRRFNGRVGDLLGGDGNRRMPIYRISRAGYRARHNYVAIHGHLSCSS